MLGADERHGLAVARSLAEPKATTRQSVERGTFMKARTEEGAMPGTMSRSRGSKPSRSSSLSTATWKFASSSTCVIGTPVRRDRRAA
jgi:hypothetical protein